MSRFIFDIVVFDAEIDTMNKHQYREYSEYIKSKKWRATAKLLKEQRGYICARCGKASWSIEAHHKTHERFGRELASDIELVCPACHPAADIERSKETEQRGEERRYEAGFESYVRKKYGDDPRALVDPAIREEFHDWLQSRDH